MNLVFVIKRLEDIAGGAERVLTSIISELAGRGHKITLISFDQSQAKSFYPISDKITWIKLPIGDSSKPAKFIETVRRMLALRYTINKIKPNCVISFLHSAFIPASFSLVGTGIPHIASEHIVPDHYKNKKVEFFLLCLAGLLSKKITVLSDNILDMYPAFLHTRMITMPNPVITSDQYAQPEGIQGKQKTILCVGRLTEQKDHACLIDAFSNLAADFPDWNLKIIGEGHLRPALEQKIAHMGLSNRTSMPGTSASISNDYTNAHLFVLPSLYESFGLVTAEAMSHGLPVIGFADCPGTNELILHNKTGFLVSSATDRSLALAQAMRTLMENSELRVAIGTQAKENMLYSSPKIIAEKWEQLIKSYAF